MRGKLVEDLLYQQAVKAKKWSSAPGTLYNGQAVSVSMNGIDTRDCDDINFVVNVDTVEGSGTLDVGIYHSNTNDPSTASIVSGNASPSDTASTKAQFTRVTSANDDALHIGSIRASNFYRYMWAATRVLGASANFGVVAVLGKCDRDPQSQTAVFDLNY